MKKTILVALLMVVLTTIKGYSQDSTKTLFHLSMPRYLGLYLSPEYQYGQLKEKFTSFAGGSIMLIVDKKFAVGVTMLHNTFRSFSPNGINPLILNGSLGGLKLEYSYNPDAAIHLTFPLVIGMGVARVDSVSYVRNRENDSIFYGHDRHMENERKGNRNEYFIIQPGIQVESNLFKYIKLFAGANYRFTIASDHNTSGIIPPSTFQGLSLNIGLKLGLFDLNIGKKKV